MKKLFLSLMLVAAIAAGFTSCKKEENNGNETTTHSQTFTLGDESYDVDNAITIENIQYQDSDIYNAIVLSEGSFIGESGVDCDGVVIIFKDNISAGTYTMSSNMNSFPKYVFTSLNVQDIVNFNLGDLMDNDEAYIAKSGSFTLEINSGRYTITTNNIEVVNVSTNEEEDSSVDYEGKPSKYVLATVEAGNLNDGEDDVEIVTAGRMSYTFPLFGKKNIACFITMEGDMLGFYYQGDEITPGQQANPTFIYLNGMNIDDPKVSQTGSINVEVNEDVYTVDIDGAEINGATYTMHYVGTLPYFDFPF